MRDMVYSITLQCIVCNGLRRWLFIVLAASRSLREVQARASRRQSLEKNRRPTPPTGAAGAADTKRTGALQARLRPGLHSCASLYETRAKARSATPSNSSRGPRTAGRLDVELVVVVRLGLEVDRGPALDVPHQDLRPPARAATSSRRPRKSRPGWRPGRPSLGLPKGPPRPTHPRALGPGQRSPCIPACARVTGPRAS